MIIHLIRHTTPDIEPGLCYGQADLDLAPSFDSELEQIKTKTRIHYDALYTSPLKRCAQLSEHFKASQRHIEPRIMEYNFGDWERKPWSELRTEQTRQWSENFVEIPAPGGENILMMKARVDEFFDELLQSSYENVALITHSGVQRLLHARVLNTPLELMFRLQLPFGAVIEISKNKGGILNLKHL